MISASECINCYCYFSLIQCFDCFTDATAAERPQLRLILKVGGGHTPDPPSDHVRQAITSNIQQYSAEDESRQSSHYSYSEGGEREKHKKKKEKKKKKNKDKDKEKKKHKHHKV